MKKVKAIKSMFPELFKFKNQTQLPLDMYDQYVPNMIIDKLFENCKSYIKYKPTWLLSIGLDNEDNLIYPQEYIISGTHDYIPELKKFIEKYIYELKNYLKASNVKDGILKFKLKLK